MKYILLCIERDSIKTIPDMNYSKNNWLFLKKKKKKYTYIKNYELSIHNKI